MKAIKIVVSVLALTVGAAMPLDRLHADDAHHPAELTNGEVKKVDKEAGKLTLKRGPVLGLNMPPMMMKYRMKEKADGAYTVVKIEPVK